MPRIREVDQHQQAFCTRTKAKLQVIKVGNLPIAGLSNPTNKAYDFLNESPYSTKPIQPDPELVCAELLQLEKNKASLQQGIELLFQSGYPESAQMLSQLAM